MVGASGISRRQFIAGAGAALTLTGLYGIGAVSSARSMQSPEAATPAAGELTGYEAQGIVPVAYSDVDGRGGAFKLAIQEVDGRWLLYMGHLWHGGWTIMDVTDPSQPRVVNFIDGPENTWTIQMEVAEGKMITSLEHKPESWGGDPNAPSEEGVLIWDLSQDPVNPQLLGQYRTGGSGTHRNFYAGGPYVHLAAGMPGYSENIYVIIDISDPASPREVGRWSLPEQNPEIAEPGVSVHGPPYVVGNLVYLPYGAAGLVILDISDISQPRKVGQLDFSPPFLASIGVHSVLPLPERNLTLVASEAIRSSCEEPLNHVSVVDTSDPSNPVLVSIFPVPEPPPGSPYRDFCEKGGRFGPHSIITARTRITRRTPSM